jgi:orotate phosphoribosyltransferase
MESAIDSSLSAKHIIEKRYGIKIYPIINADDILNAIEGGVIEANEYLEKMKAYVKRYRGV